MNTENVSIKTFIQWRTDIKGNGTMLADYCWTLARDAPAREYKQQAKREGGGKKNDFVTVK
jgi:hypothetical protein